MIVVPLRRARRRNQVMQLRAFRPDDLETLYKIDSSCFPEGVSYTLDEIEAFATRRGSRTWVAEESEQVAGFLIAQRTPAPSVHIVTIDVIEDARRRGVGAALMDAAEAWARGLSARRVSLETAEDNHAAQAFYEQRQYVKVRKIAHYYADGTAAWVMVKRLN